MAAQKKYSLILHTRWFIGSSEAQEAAKIALKHANAWGAGRIPAKEIIDKFNLPKGFNLVEKLT